jgi:hypothetical protein
MVETQEFGRKYNQTLASAIAGSVGENKQGNESGLRTAAGKMPRLSDLLPTHSQAWLNAIQQYVSEMFDAAGEQARVIAIALLADFTKLCSKRDHLVASATRQKIPAMYPIATTPWPAVL